MARDRKQEINYSRPIRQIAVGSMVLLLIILFPEIAMFLPRTLMPDSFG